jgi:hypothetical protein
MPERSNTPPSLDDEVARVSDEVVEDRAKRQKASLEQAEHEAVLDSWFSRKRGVLVALIVAVPVLALLVTLNITDQSLDELLMPDPPAALGLRRAQEALDGVVRRVRVYRDDYSELPDSLAEVGAPKGDWTYEKELTGHYQIRLKLYGQVVTFNSAENKTAPE